MFGAARKFKDTIEVATTCFVDELAQEVMQKVHWKIASAPGSDGIVPDLVSEVLSLKEQLKEADYALLQMLKGSILDAKLDGKIDEQVTSQAQPDGRAGVAGDSIPLQSAFHSNRSEDKRNVSSSSRNGRRAATHSRIALGSTSVHVGEVGQPLVSIASVRDSEGEGTGPGAAGNESGHSSGQEEEEEGDTRCQKHDVTDLVSTSETQRRVSKRSSRTSKISQDSGPVRSRNSLLLWHVWMHDDITGDASPACSTALSTSENGEETEPSVLNKSQPSTKAGDLVRGRGPCQWMVTRPNSIYRISWDLLSCFVLAFDIVSVSLALAFDIEADFFQLMDLAIVLFWSFDFCQSFLSGYHDGGVVELRPLYTSKRYLRNWFIFDLTLLIIDWSNLVNHFVSNRLASIMRLGKTMRVARVMRVIRIMRAVKVLRFMDSLSENVRSETTRELLKILKMIVGIAFMNHFVACGWHIIGTMDMPHQNQWVDSIDETATVGYMYTTALHWSLTQFTPASMEVVPRNVVERVYTIIVILFALMCFSSLLSTITQAMMNLQHANGERLRLKETVDRFITENELTLELGNRITHFIRRVHRLMRSCVHEEDIPQLKNMPTTLVIEMRQEVFMPVLRGHPVLDHLGKHDKHWMARLCHLHVQQRAFQQDAEVFTKGDVAKKMYFVRAGQVKYNHAEKHRDVTVLEPGSQLCEMPLWVKWQHMGRVMTLTPCELVLLQASGFRQLAGNFADFHQCQEYARIFAELLSEEGGFTDTWGDFLTTKLIYLRSFGLTGNGGEMAMTSATSLPGLTTWARKVRRFARLKTSSSDGGSEDAGAPQHRSRFAV
mmetsp:Transcript_60003/g.134873  ORF Transcript_60003/g.134873 Transcript_60003/m.134873 type:complete len:833 (+) Transcript_60003:97-2595(+)